MSNSIKPQTKLQQQQQQIQSSIAQTQSQAINQQQQQGPNHTSSNNILPVAAKSQAQSPHPVPPRYHPPPQPTSGILKPPLKSHVPMFPPSTSGSAVVDFQLKYPPEVPKLASLYLHQQQQLQKHQQLQLQTDHLPLNRPPPGRPPQIRLPPGAIQHHTPPTQQQQQQQVVPPVPSSSVHRLTPADELSARLTATHLAAQQAAVHHQTQLQHPDMLKFVRKADSDTSTTTSSNSGRLSVEQPTKQYVQVIPICICAWFSIFNEMKSVSAIAKLKN